MFRHPRACVVVREIVARSTRLCYLREVAANPAFPQERSAGEGPVGAGNHTVREGECVSSIAANRGLKVDSIWDDPANAGIRAIRVQPNVLLPRDRLTIPDRARKEESRATDNLARFQLEAEPTFIRIRVKHRDRPVSGKPFTLVVGAQTFQGLTDGTGLVEQQILPGPTTGFLRVIDGTEIHEIVLAVGKLHPVDTPTGIQQRLHTAGFDCGRIDGIIGPITRNAIRRFQTKFGLPPDGIAGPGTRAKLKEEHGC